MTANPASPPSPGRESRHSLMERSPLPMAELEGAGHIIRYANPTFCLLVGKPREAIVARPFAETMQEGDGCLAVLDRIYRTGEAETHAEPERPGPHPVYWSYAMWPVLGADQNTAGVMMQVTETSRFHQQASAINEALVVSSVRQHELTEAAEKLNEQLQAEIADRKAAYEALRESEARYRMLFEEIDEGFCIIEKVETVPGEPIDFRYIAANPAFAAQSGVGDVVGKTIREAFPGETQEWFDTYDAILRTGKAVRFERDLMTQGRVLELYAVRVEDETRRRVAVIFTNITERKQDEERQKVLLNELSHRVKNMLATVQAIAMQTMHNAPTMKAFQDAFEARLDAIAKTHNLLMQNPSQVVMLHDLVTGELSHYAAADGSRYAIEGDGVWLESNRAVPIGMMFHELATNAAKYGALSAPSGRVRVSWTVSREPRSLHLEWVESNGPTVKKPTRRGFGSRLIERGLAHQLGADVRLIFDPGGVCCAIDIPLSPAAETE